MRFHKLGFVLVIVVLALSAALPTAQAQNQIPAKLPDLNGRTINAVTAQDYPPLTFVDESGKGVGMEYEVLTEICLRLNCKLTWKTAAWDGMITAINQKQYDLGFDGISITDERKQQVDFSEPYLIVQQKFLVRADENRFKDGKSFAANTALKIGAQAGTSGFYTGSSLLGLKEGETSPRLVLYENFGISVQALLKGDVDAVITDVAAGRGFVGAYTGKLKLLDEILNVDPLGFIFPKGSDLVAPFNAAIASMRYDRYLDYVENKWFFLYQPPAQPGSAPAATPAATQAATQAR